MGHHAINAKCWLLEWLLAFLIRFDFAHEISRSIQLFVYFVLLLLGQVLDLAQSFFNPIHLALELREVLADFSVVPLARNDWLSYLLELFKFTTVFLECSVLTLSINPIDYLAHLSKELVLY